ncbi:MAG: glycosyltransferase family 2 protein [Planctomycetota bacterium]
MSPVSVIVPLYNKAPWVGRAIRSVLAQTHQEFEIVVVDDGSTDGGAEIVAAIGDPRIRLFRQRNSGVSEARNRGIAEARFPLVAFLDADDEWLPEFVETIMALRAKYPFCRVFATSYVRRGDTGTDLSPIFRGIPDNWEGILARYFEVASRSDPPLWSSAVAVARSALVEVGGFVPRVALGEDLLTWARLAARFDIAYSAQRLAIFWNVGSHDRVPDKPDVIGEELVGLRGKGDPGRVRGLERYIALWHRMRAVMFLHHGLTEDARHELRQMARLGVSGWQWGVYRLFGSCPAPICRISARLYARAKVWGRAGREWLRKAC